MKKILPVVLAGVMALSLTACSSDSAEETTAATTAAETEAETEEEVAATRKTGGSGRGL